MKLYILVACLCIVGCSTGYKSEGLTGGFKETKTGDRQYRVVFSGNQYTSDDKVKDYLKVRCAELTVWQGYKYYELEIDSTLHDQSSSMNFNAVTGHMTSSVSNKYQGIAHIRMINRNEITDESKTVNALAFMEDNPVRSHENQEYDQAPTLIGGYESIRKNLDYPEKAKEEAVEGTVMVRAFIDETGHVVNTYILSTVPKGFGFGSAARKVVKISAWHPAMKGDTPVRATAVVPVRFRL